MTLKDFRWKIANGGIWKVRKRKGYSSTQLRKLENESWKFRLEILTRNPLLPSSQNFRRTIWIPLKTKHGAQHLQRIGLEWHPIAY